MVYKQQPHAQVNYTCRR